MKTRNVFVTIILLIGIFLSITIPNATALTTNTEDFESFEVLQQPDQTWYDFSFAGGTGSTAVSTEQAASGTKSLKTTWASANFDPVFSFTTDLCHSSLSGLGSLQVAYRTSSLATASSFITVSPDGSTGLGGATAWRVFFTIDVTTGNVAGRVEDDTTAITSSLGTVTINTWHLFRFRFTGCSTAVVNFDFGTLAGGLTSTASADALGDLTNDPSSNTFLRFTYNAANSFFVDDIIFKSQDPPPPTTSFTTAAVVDLLNMDVDDAGSNLIALTNTGDQVRSYSATALGLSGSALADCDGHETGIIAGEEHIAFIVCDGSSTFDPIEIKIRHPNMGTPTSFGTCTNTDACEPTIQFLDVEPLCTDLPDSIRLILKEIKEIVSAPIDYSIKDADENGVVAFVFSTEEGQIGILTYVARNGACDQFGFFTRQYQSLGAIDQICAWTSGTTHFIGAADIQSSVKLYSYTIQFNADGFDTAQPNINDPQTYASLSGAQSISCTLNRLLACTGSTLFLMDTDTGSQIWSRNVASGCTARGADISRDGKWYTYIDGTNVLVGNATSNLNVVSLVKPAGGFKDIEISHAGQRVWVATSSNIGTAPIFTFTTQTPESDTPGPIPTATPTVPVAGGTFGESAKSLGEAFGGGPALGNALIGLLIVALCFALGAWALLKKAPLIGGIILGGLAFAIFALNGTFHPSVTGVVLIVIGGTLYIIKR